MQTFKITPYKLALKQPLYVLGQTLSQREGIHLTVTTAGGHSGFGEIAPLPGLHEESLAQAKTQVEEVASCLENIELASEAQISLQLDSLRLYPSVRCGLEFALFNILARQQNCSLEKLLNQNPLTSVPINALIQANIKEPDLEQELERRIGQKYSCVKIKCGGLDLEDDVERVKLAAKILPSSIQLRLDANQNWTLPQFETFIKAIDLRRIEYIEEPLRDFRQLVGAVVPIALDESLTQLYPDQFTPPEYIKAFILKPMAQGGISQTLKWVYLAKKHKLKVVISSCLESPQGLDHLYKLALAVHQNNVAAGLDTNEIFSHT